MGAGTGHGSGSVKTRFQKGHRGRPGAKSGGAGQSKGQKKPPQLLVDMRAVFEGTSETDKGQGQKNLRAFLNEDLKGFIKEMLALEKVWEAACERGGSGEGDLPLPWCSIEEEKLRDEEIRGLLAGVLERSGVKRPEAVLAERDALRARVAELEKELEKELG